MKTKSSSSKLIITPTNNDLVFIQSTLGIEFIKVVLPDAELMRDRRGMYQATLNDKRSYCLSPEIVDTETRLVNNE
jgi:hypothetical protein